MVRSTVKGAVAAANMNFWLSEVEEDTRGEIENYTSDVLLKFVDHVEKDDEKYRKLGTALDSFDNIYDSEDEDFKSYTNTSDSETA